MLSPYGLDITESCRTCQMRPERLFCDLSPEALQAFEVVKCAAACPKGVVLFVEGQMRNVSGDLVKRHDLLQFLKDHPEACFKVAELLSEKYRTASEEVRWLGLSRTAGQRLAKLRLEWRNKNEEQGGTLFGTDAHARRNRTDDWNLA